MHGNLETILQDRGCAADTHRVISQMDNDVRTESAGTRDLFDGLGPEWRLVAIGAAADLDDDRELLLVGPPGVVALATRRRPGATGWVGARSVAIDGQHTVFLQNARSHAGRWATLLDQACGGAVHVTPAVVLAGLGGFNVRQMPADVHVTTDRRLRGWLASLPARLEADEIEAIADTSARLAR